MDVLHGCSGALSAALRLRFKSSAAAATPWWERSPPRNQAPTPRIAQLRKTQRPFFSETTRTLLAPASAGPFLLERSRAPLIVLLRRPLFRQYPLYPLPFGPASPGSFLVHSFWNLAVPA